MRKNIKSVYKLKRVMKTVGLVKYYKYIYSIYHAITGKQLITIPNQDYHKYITQFKNIEMIFKKNNRRHNLDSYNVIIYFLMIIFMSYNFIFSIFCGFLSYSIVSNSFCSSLSEIFSDSAKKLN